MFSGAHQAGWNGPGSSIHICSTQLNMTHTVENSVRTASVHCLTHSHFIWSRPHAALLRFHLGILLKSVAYWLKIYIDISVVQGVFSFFLPESANRAMKTASVVLSVLLQWWVCHRCLGASHNDPPVQNKSLGSCSKPAAVCITSTLLCTVLPVSAWVLCEDMQSADMHFDRMVN